MRTSISFDTMALWLIEAGYLLTPHDVLNLGLTGFERNVRRTASQCRVPLDFMTRHADSLRELDTRARLAGHDTQVDWALPSPYDDDWCDDSEVYAGPYPEWEVAERDAEDFYWLDHGRQQWHG